VTEIPNLVFLAEAIQNLGLVCAVAFATVMTILSILAFTFRMLTHIFKVVPETTTQSEPTTDAATAGAIQAAVAQAVPGGRVVRIESKK